jgi:hypothetical protein
MEIRNTILAGVAAGCVLGLASWMLFGKRAEREPDQPVEVAKPEAPELLRPGDLAAAGFAIKSASWGVTDDREPVRPEPSGKSEAQLRRERFAREAAERWEGTEVFVRQGRILRHGGSGSEGRREGESR